jgi:hypothetical protein
VLLLAIRFRKSFVIKKLIRAQSAKNRFLGVAADLARIFFPFISFLIFKLRVSYQKQTMIIWATLFSITMQVQHALIGYKDFLNHEKRGNVAHIESHTVTSKFLKGKSVLDC